ncbi:MAG: hypothetical protein JNK64_21920 [Myxococcales bacterium]|nr:hypothetical protein [Myxococcales bacterium]
MTAWPWRDPAPTRQPHAMLVVFADGPLADDVPMSLARFGVPRAELIGELDVRTIPRGVDPAWFDGWRAGSLRAIATTDLGDALPALDRAAELHVVIAQPSAPADLGYLQALWGVARWMVARGASIVLDVHAHRFLRGDALPAADAPFDADREVRLVFETDSTRTDRAHALHTRGLRKFGAPELVALCGQADAPLVSSVVSQVAAAVAGGAELARPRHGVDVSTTETWWIVDDRDGLAELLQLNNAARVMLDGRGQHLVGAAARLRDGAS